MPLSPTVPLDPGITEAVNRLSDGGIHTFESCDGSTGHSFSEPTVKFYRTQAEGWKALGICKDYGFAVLELNRTRDVEDGEPSGPYWKIVLQRQDG